MNDIKMIYNEPVAVWNDFIIISDVHLGGDKVKDVKSTIEIVRRIMNENNKEKILILGDLMASISKVDEEAGIFIRELSKEYELHIVKGNHDGGIEKYKPFCKIYGPEGGIIEGIGFFHGHAWPKKEIFEQEIVLMGHLHPKIVLGKEFKWSEKVWMRGELNIEKLKEKYGEIDIKENVKLYIFPSFGLQTGTYEKEYESQKIAKEIFIKSTLQIYLLNGIKIK